MINIRKKHFVLHAYRLSFIEPNPKSKWLSWQGGFGFQIETKHTFFGIAFLELDFWRKKEEEFDED
jgi:hypothetical protein